MTTRRKAHSAKFVGIPSRVLLRITSTSTVIVGYPWQSRPYGRGNHNLVALKNRGD
jgi:hypothetical protein